MPNQKDIIEIISEKTGFGNEDARILFNTVFSIIKEEIDINEPFKLRGFGTFKLRTVAEKSQISLQTGEQIIVPEHNVIAFKPQFEIEPKPQGILLENEFVSEEPEAILESEEEADESEEIEEIEEEVEEEVNDEIINEPIEPSVEKEVIVKHIVTNDTNTETNNLFLQDLLKRVQVLEDEVKELRALCQKNAEAVSQIEEAKEEKNDVVAEQKPEEQVEEKPEEQVEEKEPEQESNPEVVEEPQENKKEENQQAVSNALLEKAGLPEDVLNEAMKQIDDIVGMEGKDVAVEDGEKSVIIKLKKSN